MPPHEPPEGGGPHRTVHSLRMYQAVYVTVNRPSRAYPRGSAEEALALGRYDRRNPLHLTHNRTGEVFENELRTVRAFLLCNWSELHTLPPFQREMVREMMALARYYQMLGFQFEPEDYSG